MKLFDPPIIFPGAKITQACNGAQISLGQLSADRLFQVCLDLRKGLHGRSPSKLDGSTVAFTGQAK